MQHRSIAAWLPKHLCQPLNENPTCQWVSKWRPAILFDCWSNISQRDPRVSLVLGFKCWLHKAQDASASVQTYAKPRGKDVAPNLVRLLSTKGPPAVEGKPFKNAKNGQKFLMLAFSIGQSWTIKNVEFDSWGVRVPAHESCTKHHTCKLKEKRIEALLFLENPLTTLPSLQQVTHTSFAEIYLAGREKWVTKRQGCSIPIGNWVAKRIISRSHKHTLLSQ